MLLITNRFKNKAMLLKIISWIQIIGGIFGLFSIARSLLETDVVNGPLLLVFLCAISVFLFSIYAGKLLLKNESEGLILSMVNQMIQLFQFSVFGYGWNYNSGPQISIGIKGFAFTLDFSNFLSSFHLYYNSNQAFFFKINIISLIIMIIIIKARKANYQTEKS